MSVKRESIAIVGIGGIFPQSPTIDAFWDNISKGVNTAREIPDGRWPIPVETAYNVEKGKLDSAYSKKACFIENFKPDFKGLNIDPHFAAGLDPAFHLLLHAGGQAFNEAKTSKLNREKVGVIIGNLVLPSEKSSQLAYELLGRQIEKKVLGDKFIDSPKKVEPINRFSAGLPAGILAKALNLGGGSYTLDAACASSLYALSLACDQLLSGRADAMLAGGLSRPDCFYTQMGFSQLRALSPDGVSSPFDEKSNGLVVGEGCGMLLLKRLSDAERDGDHIYGCISGVGLSNDVGGSLLAPNSDGQISAMESAYKSANLKPSDIDIIECHATGTPVGDAVEVESLKRVWNGDKGKYVIGSVKSNIGHLLTAAGSAGVIKMLLALKNNTLPPTANFNSPAKNLNLTNSPFHVLKEAEEWKSRGKNIPRRAAVSAFGFGGINAHLILEEYLPKKGKKVAKKRDKAKVEPIAIVGLDAHFGKLDTKELFTERVLGGADHIKAEADKKDYGIEEKGFFIKEISIPNNQYRIPPLELKEMQPQQLLMLKVAAGAINDANLSPENGLNTGVFIGIGLDLNTTNFHLRWMMEKKGKEWIKEIGLKLTPEEETKWIESLKDSASPPLTANSTLGSLGSIVASRISREFKFGGPSFTVSSEEGSGMQAIETAVRLINNGTIKQAIVGGVDLTADIRSIAGTKINRHLSTDGNSAPFDSGSDGIILGEGAAALILKPLKDAQKDGNKIYAVIEGISSTTGDNAYQRGFQSACNEAQIDSSAITLIEGNGTGFAKEDSIEAKALSSIIKIGKEKCFPLSSVKGDIGHTGAASAIASIVKTSLALDHEIVPPIRNLKKPVHLSNHSLYLPQKGHYWLRNKIEGERYAAVASASVDGNCRQTILRGYSDDKKIISSNKVSLVSAIKESLFIFSGLDRSELIASLEQLREIMYEFPRKDVRRLAKKWWEMKGMDETKELHLSIISESRNDLTYKIDKASSFLKSDEEVTTSLNKDNIFFSSEPMNSKGDIAFVYPGSGNHFVGMGRDIGFEWPELLHNQDTENGLLKNQFAPCKFWLKGKDEINATDTLLGQVSVGTLYTDMALAFGLKPRRAIGYSLGETVSLFSLRAWRDRDEMFKRLTESPLFTHQLGETYDVARKAWKIPKSKPVEWVTGIISAPSEAVRAAIKKNKRVYLLIVNTPSETVVGGDREAVESLAKDLKSRFFGLNGVTIAHCDLVKAVEKEYHALHLFKVHQVKGVTYYSGAKAEPYKLNTENTANSILGHALHGIDYPKVIDRAYEDGARIFIEMGPAGSCSRMINQILKGREHLALSFSTNKGDELSNIVRVLARLASEGVRLNLDKLYSETPDRETIIDANRTLIPVGKKTIVDIAIPLPQNNNEFITPTKLPDITKPANEVAVETGNVAIDATQLIESIGRTAEAGLEAHQTFLNFSEKMRKAMEENISRQIAIINNLSQDPASMTSLSNPPTSSPEREVAFDRDKCMEIAIGKIGDVLGADYAIADSYPTRVRLPDEPLMLVDRIISVEGERLSLTNGRVVTEHDVKHNGWYLDCGRIPTCIAVEAGQADLFLSGYLGIDLKTKGLSVYRLLDAVVTFHSPLPVPGDVISYDIRIERFFRQGDTYLFNFNFESTVNGQPLLSMREGCAGFFSQEELDAGKGLVTPNIMKKQKLSAINKGWEELIPVGVESYDAAQVKRLRNNDLIGCFGPLFEQLNINNPVTLPTGLMELADRVIEVNPEGGKYGGGFISAEADIHPDDWFLTCHFADDNVMPGTLMYECCLHTLRIYLLRIGWVGEVGEVVYEPIPGVSSGLKCRGQVIDTTKVARYDIHIKEIGYRPEPYVIADAIMYADDKPIVEISNMSVQLSGLTKEKLEARWNVNSSLCKREAGRDFNNLSPSPLSPPLKGGESGKRIPLFDNESILAFSIGNPSEAFGEPYKVFDSERIVARLPGPPYKFLDRIVATEGEQYKMVAGGSATAEYDVPSNEWYFKANNQPVMPFAILLEIALQPCGWLAAYIGSALTSDIDLSFRNLGGSAIQYMPVFPDVGTLTIKSDITKVSQSGGMIIQNYDYEVRSNKGIVYKGDTYFGFFTKAALAEQVGIRDAKPYIPTQNEISTSKSFEYPSVAPYPSGMMRMLDEVKYYIKDGGPKQLGYVEGIKYVDPNEWFFKAHFYQDPVCPGSLGLKSYLQLLRVVAQDRWGSKLKDMVETVVMGEKHAWLYRGQIVQKNKEVKIQAVVNSIDDDNLIIRADGYLSADGKYIYQMINIGIQYGRI